MDKYKKEKKSISDKLVGCEIKSVVDSQGKIYIEVEDEQGDKNFRIFVDKIEII